MATFTIKTTLYMEEEKNAFIEGWKDAGGYMGDTEGPSPWCAPWCHIRTITLEADTMPPPDKAGALWWAKCRQEVEELLREEAAMAEEEQE